MQQPQMPLAWIAKILIVRRRRAVDKAWLYTRMMNPRMLRSETYRVTIADAMYLNDLNTSVDYSGGQLWLGLSDLASYLHESGLWEATISWTLNH